MINIGDPDGPPRLVAHLSPSPRLLVADLLQISYLSSSQGFAWNPGSFDVDLVGCPAFTPPFPLTLAPSEIFLPSYVDCDYEPLENRRDPVHEILLSDEESKNMLPQ